MLSFLPGPGWDAVAYPPWRTAVRAAQQAVLLQRWLGRTDDPPLQHGEKHDKVVLKWAVVAVRDLQCPPHEKVNP